MNKVIEKMINNSLIDCEIYRYDKSIWILKPNLSRWVVEVTESHWLWFNRDHFQNIFSYLSLDIDDVENHKYILEWGNKFFPRVLRVGTDWPFPDVRFLWGNEKGNFIDNILEDGDKVFKINRVYPDKGFDYNWKDQFDAVKVIAKGLKICRN